MSNKSKKKLDYQRAYQWYVIHRNIVRFIADKQKQNKLLLKVVRLGDKYNF